MQQMGVHRYAWISLGQSAFGLIEVDRMVAVVYWADSESGLDARRKPTVHEAGYFLVECADPKEHVRIVDGVNWDEALARAAWEFHARRRTRGNR